MLARLGAEHVHELFADVPEKTRFPQLNLPPALTELEVLRHVSGLAQQNISVRDWPCFIGAGAYNHYSPALVGHVMGLPQFFTAYTPYQAEVSQGTLQAMFEFQSLVCELLDMDVSNASVYDGASATAEAALMSQRITGRDRIVVAGSLHPHWQGSMQAYLAGRQSPVATTKVQVTDDRLIESSIVNLVDDDTACAIVQQPDFFGHVHDLHGLADAVHEKGALLVVAVAEATSLGLLRSPGSWGADIAVAEGQALGLPLQFGGPWAGLLACKMAHIRQLPGRIAGQTTDHEGRRGFVLTLQTREQHIRREKATSSITTAQTLLALGITAYLAAMGPSGLREVAKQSHAKAAYAADKLERDTRFRLLTPSPFYNEFAVAGPLPAEKVQAGLTQQGMLGGVPTRQLDSSMPDGLLLAFTEQNTRDEIDRLVIAMSELA